MILLDGAYRRAFATRLEMPLRESPDGLAVVPTQPQHREKP
ncbi:hypothetical protein [Thermomonas carbonis]|nr:hypothetical protein [Thermomonas carbonis]